jgi:hypothetical protein
MRLMNGRSRHGSRGACIERRCVGGRTVRRARLDRPSAYRGRSDRMDGLAEDMSRAFSPAANKSVTPATAAPSIIKRARFIIGHCGHGHASSSNDGMLTRPVDRSRRDPRMDVAIVALVAAQPRIVHGLLLLRWRAPSDPHARLGKKRALFANQRNRICRRSCRGYPCCSIG